MSTKKQLLDPIGSMCKLIALNFRKLKTKIVIKNHVILLDEPYEIPGLPIRIPTQGAKRWLAGDEKEDISELYYAIIRLIQWYLVNDDDDKDKDEYKNKDKGKGEGEDKYENKSDSENEDESESDDNDFFDFPDASNEQIDESKTDESKIDKLKIDESINNKSKSQELMTNSNKISNSAELQTMVTYLCLALSRLQETYESGLVLFALQFFINVLQEAQERKGTMTMEELNNRLPKYILKKEQDYDNLIDYDKLRQLWKLKPLKTICELYDNCFRVKADDEIPNKTKDALIDGYLTAVGATLDIIDKEFQVLITNNDKG